MTDTTALVDDYIAIWNETDPDRRRELIAQQFPGHRFELAGAPDAHHDRVRFTWHL
jgi:hypothetical protein